MNDLRLREIQLAAQKEAEELYGYDSQVTMKDGTVIPSRSATQAARYSAHVKCAILYSERAAGLVEAATNLLEWNENYPAGMGSIVGDRELDQIIEQFRAALHAFNTNTNNPKST